MKQVSCLVFHAECMSGLYRLEKTFFLAGGYLHGHILNLGEIIQSRTKWLGGSSFFTYVVFHE